MKPTLIKHIIRSLLLFMPMALLHAAEVNNLRCEFRANPLGIDAEKPRLSWIIESKDAGVRGVRQTASQVLVASTPELLAADKGDLWDSGKMTSDRSIQVEYAGKPLESRARCHWKVRVWDEKGNPSAWSQPAFWTMGLLKAEDWSGVWIGFDGNEPLEEGKSDAARSPGNLKILKANYAARDGAGSADVTGKVSSLVKDGILEVKVEPSELGGDPAPNHAKDLTVEYEYDGVLDSLSAADFSGLKIPEQAWTKEEEERRLPARHLRKGVRLDKPVACATAYFSGLGISELYVNGKKVGDAVLSPGMANYSKRVFYKTYDVTSLLRPGDNVIGAILGNGRFHGIYAKRDMPPWPKMKLQVEVEYTDGTVERIVSDETWKLTTKGPILSNNEYDGEEFDARRDMPGWAEPGFDDKGWMTAKKVGQMGGKLSCEPINPIRVTGNIKPVTVSEPKPGVFIYDFGQNFVGWCRLRVKGPAGTVVRLRHAEELKPNGRLDFITLGHARATDYYTLKGGEEEVWEPRFTYHGFRYAEVTGYPGKPGLDALEGRIVNDDIATAGEFSCSNPLINQIYKNVVWGVRGNYRSLPTDCPQRNERWGWLGDRSVECRGEMFLFDVAGLYEKWVNDMADSQSSKGGIPDMAPGGGGSDSVTWPSTFLFAPLNLLEQYDDTALIARHYEGMAKWTDHMIGYMKDGLMSRDQYGDWCVPPALRGKSYVGDPSRKTSPTMLAAPYFYKCLRVMQRFATLVNKPEDATRYGEVAEQLKTAMNQTQYNKEKGYYDNGSQTATILPLAFNMAPEGEKARVFDHLVSKIEVESDGHLATGLVGTQWLCKTLTEGGRPDLMYRIATNKTYPSWGYMVEKGATTIWELWNGDTAGLSHNHVMMVGDLVIWLYEDVAGIRTDPEKRGFKHIQIKPLPVGDLTWVKASFDSIHGRIASSWKRENGRYSLEVTIPPNTTAEVFVLAKDAASVTESGKPAAQAKGVKFQRIQDGAAVYAVGSGTYRFESELPDAKKYKWRARNFHSTQTDPIQ